MSFTHRCTATISGGRIVPIIIEIDIQPGLPYFSIIGLPDKRIEESKERVRSAIKNCGISFPLGKITINLVPSYIPKQGTGFDLGIALGILQAIQKIPVLPENIWVIGELSLNGDIRSQSNLTGFLVEAHKQKVKGCIIPEENMQDAQTIHETPVLLTSNLKVLLDTLLKKIVFSPQIPLLTVKDNSKTYLFDSIFGQLIPKRCLEIALAGGHNLLLNGPPGSGKTMLAKAAYQLLPPLRRNDLLEVAQVYTIASQDFDMTRTRPPFRQPHHTISRAGLLASGSNTKPGEVCLAHKGILFLDEIVEMSREAKESLRQPLQDKEVRLHKNGVEYTYPADCLVVAAQNACPCGLRGVEGKNCICSIGDLLRYDRALSTALLDRFDLFCEVPKLKLDQWDSNSKEEKGKLVAQRIKTCRELQYKRLNKLNGYMTTQEIKVHIPLSVEIKTYLKRISEQLYLSGRGIAKVLMVAKTIADLEGKEIPTRQHI